MYIHTHVRVRLFKIFNLRQFFTDRFELLAQPCIPIRAFLYIRDGTGQGGTGRDEIARDGTRWYRTGRDGIRPDEMGRDGTGREGMGWNGTGRDGAGRDGTGRDGRDGTETQQRVAGNS
jgi:hypothetical protein